MTIYERRQRLIHEIGQVPGITIQQLADLFEVSSGTIRNDIDALENDGILRRVRGGAVLTQNQGYLRQSKLTNQLFSSRIQNNADAKRNIALQAAKTIQDGDSIFLDASSTVYHLTQLLFQKQNLRIVTNSLESARILARNLTHTVMLVGGIVRTDGESVIGPWADQFLESVNTKIAFVSCSGFTPETGMYEIDIFEAQIRLNAIQSAGKVIALVDSSKFGEVDLTPSIPATQINHLYTDTNLSIDWQFRLQSASIPFTICSIEQSPTLLKELI